ncbi:MAG: DEAD/DEAH box helicase [Firmicutes bacterium]|nr:DEAD/DEAH box helicase [Bacillota bacterium]
MAPFNSGAIESSEGLIGGIILKVESFLGRVKAWPDYQDQIIHVESIPARAPIYGTLSEPLSPRLSKILSEMGIENLYSHQVSAIDAIRAGKDVTIVTSTASGKTLCYNIPVIERLCQASDASGATPSSGPRALYVFPTKALAQDQLRGILRFKDIDPDLPIVAGAYDGDTPAATRKKLRERGNVILTNPDMLHQGILPHHPSWSSFFANLEFVVIDEIHSYRGVFGSNVANVLRRLSRILRHYRANPRFICCSATIANPGEFSEKLTGRKMTVIDNDGSPKGPKKFVFWNPPFVGKGQAERKSSNAEAERLLAELISQRTPAIGFVKARVVAELIYRYVQDRLQRIAPSLVNCIKPYRGGYLPEERRAIEQALFSGELLGVVSTNALELGVDIGGLDAALIVGYPGTIASTWQQAGRAGRSGEEALAILIANDSAIDQYLMHHPDYFFGKPVESAIIDPHNPYVVARHLRCAAFELPIGPEDVELFGDYTQPILEILQDRREVIRVGDRWYWKKTGYPADQVRLRNMSDNTYNIVDSSAGVDGGKVIGTMDELSAFEQIHPQAIYMHDGETYFVRDLDINQRVAYVEPINADYFTQSVAERRVQVDSEEESKVWRKVRLSFGELTVMSMVYMFKKIKFYSRDSLGFGKIALPPQTMETTGFWLPLPPELAKHVSEWGRDPMEGLLGVGNVINEVIPLFVMCDPRDIGTAVDASNLGFPTLFVYDRYPGGVGFSERSFSMIEEIISSCLDVITECTCENGCPSCVGAPEVPFSQYDPDTSPRGRIPDKDAALIILHDLLEREPYIPRTRPRWAYLKVPGEANQSLSGAVAENQSSGMFQDGWKTARRKDLPPGVEARIRRLL